MSRPWSNNPNAPKIPYIIYFAEKLNMCSAFTTAIIYGVVVSLFFRCMEALLNPVNRKKGGIKWGLVIHTLAMFSFLTVDFCVNFAYQSFGYINCEFPGDKLSVGGPCRGHYAPFRAPLAIVSEIMFYLNMWLADGLLLYRCYIIYSMNYWAVAFPFLMYLASIVTSILAIVQLMHPGSVVRKGVISFNYLCYPISLSLTLLLTLMIIARLTLHGRSMRNAMGSGANGSGLYKAIATMIVESYALYAVTFIVVIALMDAKSYIEAIFDPILAGAQVIASYLVILRVANRRALTSDTVVASENRGSLHFRTQESESLDSNWTSRNDGCTIRAERTERKGPEVVGNR